MVDGWDSLDWAEFKFVLLLQGWNGVVSMLRSFLMENWLTDSDRMTAK